MRHLNSYENFAKNTTRVYFNIQDNILKIINPDFEVRKKFQTNLYYCGITVSMRILIITLHTSETKHPLYIYYYV